jgi:DNA-binding NarL/FixJ family response regulator
MSITVLLADDSVLMRKSMANLLELDPEIHVIAQGDSSAQAMMLASTLYPQVIVLDVRMCDVKGVTPSLIKLAFADSKVLAVSFSTDDETKALANSFGAVELLDKSKLAHRLIPAIRRCVGIN